MNCDAFDHRLQEILDDRDRPEFDEELRGHARECDNCCQVLEIQAGLFNSPALDPSHAESVAASEIPSLTDGFSSRVIDQYRQPGLRRYWQAIPVSRLAMAGTVAATLLISWVVMQNRSTDPGPSELALSPRATSTDTVDDLTPDNPEAGPENVASSSERITVGTPGSDPLAAIHLIGLTIPTVDTLSVTVEELLNDDPETTTFATPVTRGIRPVANSMASALNVIRRTLPGQQSSVEKPQA